MTATKQKLDVLFVEDTPEDAELAVLNLVREGFVVNWERVDNERDLRSMLSRWDPDLILSDYSMPGFNGRAALQICQEVSPDTPFIFVSGTIGEELAIESLHEGATDYVLKDNMRRLGSSVDRAVIESIERQAAREVEKERSRLIAILEATSDMVVIANPDGLLIYVNDGARKLLGLHQDMAVLTISRFVSKDQWQTIRAALPDNTREDAIWQGDANMYDENGIQIPMSLVVIGHHELNEQVQYFSFVGRTVRGRQA